MISISVISPSKYGGYKIMASENVKLLDTIEACADIIECKGGMECAFSPDDDRLSRLLTSYPITIHNIMHLENRVSLE